MAENLSELIKGINQSQGKKDKKSNTHIKRYIMVTTECQRQRKHLKSSPPKISYMLSSHQQIKDQNTVNKGKEWIQKTQQHNSQT